MFDWLWEINRWYDELSAPFTRTDRFMIFGSLAAILWFTPYLLISFAYSANVGILYVWASMGLILIPRLIWLEKDVFNIDYPKMEEDL